MGGETMAYKKINEPCFDANGNNIKKDLYTKVLSGEEKYLRISETAFIDCLINFGNKSEQLLAFLILNVNHLTNEINFTEKDIADFMEKSSFNISKRKIHSSINEMIKNNIIKKLVDGKFIFNPFYINATRKKHIEIYGNYTNTTITNKSTKKLKDFDGNIKPIECYEKTSKYSRSSITDYSFIRLFVHNLIESQTVFTSKRMMAFLGLLKCAETDDRAVVMTREEMTVAFGVKQDTVGEVLKYLTEKNLMLKVHNGKYMFNPKYISRSNASTRAKNSKKYTESLYLKCPEMSDFYLIR